MYNTIEDLEAINFLNLTQEERINIITDILLVNDNLDKFKGYLLKEDLEIICQLLFNEIDNEIDDEIDKILTHD